MVHVPEVYNMSVLVYKFSSCFCFVTLELAAWHCSHSSSSSSGAFSWRGSVSSSSDSPPHGVMTAASGGGATSSLNGSSSSRASRKLKFRSTTPSPPLSGSAPASFAGKFLHHQVNNDDGIASDESISESDEGQSTSQVTLQYNKFKKKLN